MKLNPLESEVVRDSDIVFYFADDFSFSKYATSPKTPEMNSFINLMLLLSSMIVYAQDPKLNTPQSIDEIYDQVYTHYGNGSYIKAVPLLETVIEMARKQGNDSLRATGLNDLGVMYESMGNFPKAETIYLGSKSLREKTFGKVHHDVAESLNNLAFLYELMGNYDRSLMLHLQAKEIKEKTVGTNHPSYASTLHNLGSIYGATGNYSKALPLYMQAKEIKEKVLGKEHRNYVNTLGNLAFVNRQMGNYEKSLELYEEVLELRKKVLGTSHPDYAISLNNLGLVNELLGKYKLALPYYQEAYQVSEKALGRDHPEHTVSIKNLATIFWKLGNAEKAIPLFIESKNIQQRVLGRNHYRYVNSMNNLAELYLTLEKPIEAWKTLYEAWDIPYEQSFPNDYEKSWIEEMRQVPDQSMVQLRQKVESLGVAYDLMLLKETEVKTLQWKVSDLANELLIKSRNLVSNEEDKLQILSLSNDWLHRSLSVLSSESQTQKAFELADQNKSVLLLQATKSESSYRLGELPDSLVWKDRKLLSSQSKLQAELLGKLSDEQRESKLAELNQVNIEIDQFLQFLKRRYPRYYKIKYQQSDATVADLRSHLPSDAAILEYVIAENHIHLFYLDQQKIQWYQIPVGRRELKDRISKLHANLGDYNLQGSYEEFINQSHWFYRHLIAPALETASHIKNLVIVTDGELGHLPFETFLVEKPDSDASDFSDLYYLLKDYNISYSYSATLWRENQTSPDPVNNGQILGVAANYKYISDPLVERLPADQVRRSELQPLPAARMEVQALASKYEGFYVFDSLATERVIKEIAPDFSILHFATHGVLDQERPVLSSLALTEDSDSLESNFWQAHEISKSELNADLVVLSACETGFGEFEEGNGIASLARAFMYAGAPSLVVSLWQVHDQATSKLMSNFYDFLDEGLTKDQALREAKLAYISGAKGIMAHPAFWSPFIMMGKTEPVKIERRTNNMGWMLGMGAMILLLCLMAIRRSKHAS